MTTSEENTSTSALLAELERLYQSGHLTDSEFALATQTVSAPPEVHAGAFGASDVEFTEVTPSQSIATRVASPILSLRGRRRRGDAVPLAAVAVVACVVLLWLRLR